MSTLRYLRCLKKPRDYSHLVVGEVYALHWCERSQTWDVPTSPQHIEDFTEADLRDHFEPATREDFEASIRRAMAELEAVETEHQQLVQEMAGVSQLALASGETESPAELDSSASTTESPAPSLESDETALARKSQPHPASALRNRAHAVKRKIGEFAVTVKAKKEIIESKLKQQLAAFQPMIDEMNKQVEKLTEVVHMVNLYLGRDEAITCLREGARAAAGTPISIRQSVLYMDEECAEQETHGIDFSEIKKFDQWLLAKPEHLEQVIPNPKGVVVLQVRRSPKEYDYERGDIGAAISAAAKNEENRKSYWLIRNGRRLHRLWTDISVGPRLIPRDDELDHFFVDTSFGRDEVIRPGTQNYYKAMEQANAHRRHYMRLLLVLQGLFDRTLLFTPWVNGVRPNLLDPNTWENELVFVRDTERVIEDGRPHFDTWLAGINQELRHGQRVIGYFPGYTGSGREMRSLVHPRNASAPKSDQVYTLLQDGDGFKFLYTRDDDVQKYRRLGRNWKEEAGYGPADKRASYRFHPDIANYICIDNLSPDSLEAMQYYLKDRRHRRSYERMIPLLRLALKMKREEMEAEQPFRDLLLNQLASLYPENPCTAEKLEQLIAWWKFKVKEHRPLLAENAKAYLMIVSEYGRQVALSPEKLALNRQIILDALAPLPDVIAIWYSGEGNFTVLRSVDGFPVFVTESIWGVVAGIAVPHEVKEWVLPYKSDYLRWEQVYTTPAWEAQPARPNRKKFLPGSDYPAALAWIQANPPKPYREQPEKVWTIYSLTRGQGNSLETEIRIAVVDFVGRSRISSHWPEKTEKHTLLDHVEEPEFRERELTWKRKRGGELEFGYTGYYGGGSYTHTSGHKGLTRGWADDDHRRPARLLWLDQAIDTEVTRRFEEVEKINSRADELQEWIRDQEEAAESYLREDWERKEQVKFLAEGGEGEFFVDHLKTLPPPKFDFSGEEEDGKEVRSSLRDVLARLVEFSRGDLAVYDGMQLAAALKHAGVRMKKPSADLLALVRSGWALKQPAPAENLPD